MKLLDSYFENVTNIAIAGHVRPDGDCTGACLAVYNYIRSYYPEIQADLYLESIPDKFLFLYNADQIHPVKDKSLVYDLFIALDCGDMERLGAAGALFTGAGRTLCVDHHVTNQNFADFNYVFSEASSTCELIFQLMDPERITKEIAECLYLGIAHDTGVFQYSCTSPKTMEIAGILMGKGIDYSKIVDETYYIKSYAQQKIWGKAMMESKLHLDGSCISSVITARHMEEFQVDSQVLDGLVSELRSTIGVETAIFLYETEDGYKASLRSRAHVDVAAIAMEFGGGGHARAAGASIRSKNPEEILQAILEKVEAQMKLLAAGE